MKYNDHLNNTKVREQDLEKILEEMNVKIALKLGIQIDNENDRYRSVVMLDGVFDKCTTEIEKKKISKMCDEIVSICYESLERTGEQELEKILKGD